MSSLSSSTPSHDPCIGTWASPLPDMTFLGPTNDSESFASIDLAQQVQVPVPPHVGAFGTKRRHHAHEGVDLYCPESARVCAVELGTVIGVEAYTGPKAGSPWWHDTEAVLVKGPSGVVCYGELRPLEHIVKGYVLKRGEHLGNVTQVLTKDKGRPMTMLHIELYTGETLESVEWVPPEADQPSNLRDITPYLLSLCNDGTNKKG